MATDGLSRALDRLHAAPFGDFLALRKSLVAELRAAGDAVSAKLLAGTPKPTRTAWALNQVARRRPELLQALFEAREAAAAPSPGDAGQLRRTARDYRDRLNEVVRAAHDVLAQGGGELDASQARRVAETLQAACAEDGDTRARLVAGTLSHDANVDDPFAGVAMGESEPEKDDGAERERRGLALQAARARVSELEDAVRVARAQARADEAAAARAARAAEDAKRGVVEVEAQLEAAQAHLTQLGSP